MGNIAIPGGLDLNELKTLGFNETNLKRLQKQLRTSLGVIPFVGAGLSIPFGYKGWSNFLLYYARQVGIDSTVKEQLDTGKFEDAGDEVSKALGERQFQNIIEQEFGDDKLVGKLDGDLFDNSVVSVLPSLARGAVINTNFDHLLEQVFERAKSKFEHVVWGAKATCAYSALTQDKRFFKLVKTSFIYRVMQQRILLCNHMNELMLFTDGSMNQKANVGYGAYLVVAEYGLSLDVLKSQVKVRRFENTSSTKLELQTLLWALSDIDVNGRKVTVYTDSQNIMGLPGRRDWLEKNDYRSRKNKRLENYKLYQEFYEMTDQADCEFVKVGGHQTSSLKNEIDWLFTLVDRASRRALREMIHSVALIDIESNLT